MQELLLDSLVEAIAEKVMAKIKPELSRGAHLPASSPLCSTSRRQLSTSVEASRPCSISFFSAICRSFALAAEYTSTGAILMLGSRKINIDPSCDALAV